MWRKLDRDERKSDSGEELTTTIPDRPPPTPRMSARAPQQRSDPNQIETLSTLPKKGSVRWSGTVTSEYGKDDSTSPYQSASAPPKQTYEQRAEARRKSEAESQRNIAKYIQAIEEESKHARYSPADDGGVNLKPLASSLSKGPPLKPLTPLPPDHQSQKPGVTRKRAVSVAKLEAEHINRLIKAEQEWMSDEQAFRDWARDSRQELYGEGVSVAETPSLLSYPMPTRDTDEINRELYDMTLHDQDFQIGGPPRPVDINSIDWDTDVSNVQGYREFTQAREAKAFASYVVFTERQEEIDMLRRMQVHGFLKDGVDIKYGYQAEGSHGAIAWLTHEGQEIGGKLREEYEKETAVTGEFVASKSEVGARLCSRQQINWDRLPPTAARSVSVEVTLGETERS